MPHLTRFTVSGYRAISAEVCLQDLGPFVALYGDNAVGKSSLMEALLLFGRLVEAVGTELRGPNRSWELSQFYQAFRQDQWMFHYGSNEVVLTGGWSSGHKAAFKLQRDGNALRLMPLELAGEAGDHLRPIQEAAALRDAPVPQSATPPPDSTDPYAALAAAVDAFEADFAPLVPFRSVPPPVVPVPDSIRRDFVNARTSADGALRARMRDAVAKLDHIFPALGPGQVEPLLGLQPHPEDVAWVTNQGATICLDRMGSGVQSAFGTLTGMASAAANVVVVDEPEAYVGQRAFDGLRAALEGAVPALCAQVWIATHAVSLAPVGGSLHILERSEGRTTVRRATSEHELHRRYGTTLEAPPRPDTLGRMADDGAVRLPPTVVARMGLKAGDWVHFLDINENSARIVTEAEFDSRHGEGG